MPRVRCRASLPPCRLRAWRLRPARRVCAFDRSSPRLAQPRDESPGLGEDRRCVVVERGDMVAVGQRVLLDLPGTDTRPQQPQAGTVDYMILRRTENQQRLFDVGQLF